MSYLMLLVSTGYRFWIRGEMHYSKAQGFAKKMAELYPVLANSSARAYAKSKGQAAVQLVMFPSDRDPTKVMYWLLATPGKGLIHEREKLQDATRVPLTWYDQYQIALTQRTRAQGGKTRWTWQIQPQRFKEYLASARDTANSGQQALTDYFSNIAHMPMFSGIREQVKEIEQYAAKTWAKQRKSPFPQVLPESLPIMPKIQVFGDMTLDDLVAAMRKKDADQRASAEAEAQALVADSDVLPGL